ncbi:hypothetical protein HK100_005366 [Physocladia obscura]|uniref:Uncharacterized protein n=1 Tax=Physocladia obscura TaxID=109957 RepID=A0AAD5STZ2_9FUNG|nr:hypothetical protein HK100_005366 [Physocladia obscura]
MFRITARQNSIYNEEKYIAEHPSTVQYSADSLDAECASQDNSGAGDNFGSRDLADFDENDAYEFSNAGADGVATTIVTSNTEDCVPNGPAPTVTSMHRMTIPRSIITSKYSGTRTTKVIEVENLWQGKGGTTIASSSNSYEPPIEEAINSVPGFHTEPVIRDRVVFQPDWKNVEIPKESPFSVTKIEEEEDIDPNDEEEFDFWVLKAMQDAANAHRQTKGLPPIDHVTERAVSQSALVEAAAQALQLLPSPTLQEPPVAEGQSTATISLKIDILNPESEKGMKYFQSSPTIPNEFRDTEEFTGIRIEITDTIEADIYITRTAPDTLTPISEMDSLLAVLDSPISLMVASDALAVDRVPQVVRRGDFEEVAMVPENPNTTEPNIDLPHVTFLTEPAYDDGDPDGFGWNLMTKKEFATRLFLTHEPQGATAALLELILRNLDVLFEYNMHITAERAGRMASEARRKSDIQLGKENELKRK